MINRDDAKQIVASLAELMDGEALTRAARRQGVLDIIQANLALLEAWIDAQPTDDRRAA